MPYQKYVKSEDDKKGVNFVLRRMVNNNRPITKIQSVLKYELGIDWTLPTINQKINGLDLIEIQKQPLRIKTELDPITELTKLRTTRSMPLGQLCEHVASFFKSVVDVSKDEDVDEKWRIAKDKVELWYNITRDVTRNLNDLTESESIAYSYCTLLYYLKNKRSTKREYGGVYSLYREWSVAYLNSLPD